MMLIQTLPEKIFFTNFWGKQIDRFSFGEKIKRALFVYNNNNNNKNNNLQETQTKR